MRKDFDGWTLVFDLDGTLVETAPDLHAALNHTLSLKGLGPVPISEIRMMIGDGAKALIRKGLNWHDKTIDEFEIDETLWPSFIAHYLDNISRLSHPYEHAIETLDILSQSGARMAVCTNKAQHLAEQVLQELKLDHYFLATLGGDKAQSKKPDGSHIRETITLAGGDPARAIMVGDSEIDERAARDAKLPFVFVTFGYGQLSGAPFDKLRVIDHWQSMDQALLDVSRPA